MFILPPHTFSVSAILLSLFASSEGVLMGHQDQPPHQKVHSVEVIRAQRKALNALLTSNIAKGKEKQLGSRVYDVFLAKLVSSSSPSPSSNPIPSTTTTTSWRGSEPTTIELLQIAEEFEPIVRLEMEKALQTGYWKESERVVITGERDTEQIERTADTLVQTLRKVRAEVRVPLLRLFRLAAIATFEREQGKGAKMNPGEAEIQQRQQQLYGELLKLFNHWVYKWMGGGPDMRRFYTEHLEQNLGDPLVVDNLIEPRLLIALQKETKFDKANAVKVVDAVLKVLEEISEVRNELMGIIQFAIWDRLDNKYKVSNKKEYAKGILKAFLERLDRYPKVAAIREELAENLLSKEHFLYSQMVESAMRREIALMRGGVVMDVSRPDAFPVVADKMIEVLERVVAERKAIAEEFHLDSRKSRLMLAFFRDKTPEQLALFKEALRALNRADRQLFLDYIQWWGVDEKNSPAHLQILNTFAHVNLRQGVNTGLRFSVFAKLAWDYSWAPPSTPVLCRTMALITPETYGHFQNKFTGTLVVRMAKVFESDFQHQPQKGTNNPSFDSLIQGMQALLVVHTSQQSPLPSAEEEAVERWLFALGNLGVGGGQALRITPGFLDLWTLNGEWLMRAHQVSSDYRLQFVVPGWAGGLPTLLWTLPGREQRVHLLQTVDRIIAAGVHLDVLMELVDEALIGKRNLDTWKLGMESSKHSEEMNDAGRALLVERKVSGWDEHSAEFLVSELEKALEWLPKLGPLCPMKHPDPSSRDPLFVAADIFHVFRALTPAQRTTVFAHLAKEKMKHSTESSYVENFKEAFKHCIFEPVIDRQSGKTTAVSLQVDQIFLEGWGKVQTKTVQKRFGEFQRVFQQQQENNHFTECLVKQIGG